MENSSIINQISYFIRGKDGMRRIKCLYKVKGVQIMRIGMKQESNKENQIMLELATSKEIYQYVMDNYTPETVNQDLRLFLDSDKVLHFEYGNVVKLGYYLYKSTVSKSELATLDKLKYNLMIITATESKFNKPFYEFTKNESLDLISDHYSMTRSVSSTVSLVYMLKDIADIFPDVFSERDVWDELGRFSFIQKIMKKVDPNQYIKKGMLLSFADAAVNRQYAAVLILLYNGVKSSLVEELDEMQRIKKKDLTAKGLNITNGQHPRFIHLSRPEVSLLRQAAEQRYLVRIARPSYEDLVSGQHNYSESELLDSDYLLRPTKRTYKQDELKVQDQYAKTITLKNRANELLKEFSEFLGKETKIKDITNSGKINAIDEYIKKGHSLSDALTKTLVKFGEWEPKLTVKDEKEDKGNKQRKTRLKRLYTISKG